MYQDIRFVVRDFIESNGIKQTHLATRCNINPQRLSRMLRGERKMTADEFMSICKVLAITSSQLEEFYARNH